MHVRQVPHWRFVVEDDGRGFDASALAAEGHVGLRIMCERGERIGANVIVQSRPGEGARVVIDVAGGPSPQGAESPEPPATAHA